MALSVSELARRTGISADTVRYYGRLGLLPETGRTAGGHRFYDESAVERVRFIKGAQWFDLRLDEIRELLDIFDEGFCPCGHAEAVLLDRITAIDHERARLDEMRAALTRLLGVDGPTAASPSPGAATRTGIKAKLAAVGDRAACGPEGCGGHRFLKSRDDELEELQARRAVVESRLSRLGSRVG